MNIPLKLEGFEHQGYPVTFWDPFGEAGHPVRATISDRRAYSGATRPSDGSSELAALRASVTSPGGTTAAALAVMDQAGIRDIISRALMAARDRSAELGRANG